MICLAAVVLLSLNTSAWAILVWNPDSPPPNGYTIKEIIDNGGLRVGDKVFASFNLVTTASPGVNAPTVDTIRIRGFFDAEGSPGIEFNGAWFANIGQSLNSNITFSVTADVPFEIVGAGLSMDAVGTIGNGTASIVEQIKSGPGFFDPTLANLFTFFQNGNPLNQLTDFGSFNPYQTIFVTKDITVQGGTMAVPGIAHLSRFSQTFKQIPEPASLFFAGLGTTLLILRRRRA